MFSCAIYHLANHDFVPTVFCCSVATRVKLVNQVDLSSGLFTWHSLLYSAFQKSQQFSSPRFVHHAIFVSTIANFQAITLCRFHIKVSIVEKPRQKYFTLIRQICQVQKVLKKNCIRFCQTWNFISSAKPRIPTQATWRCIQSAQHRNLLKKRLISRVLWRAVYQTLLLLHPIQRRPYEYIGNVAIQLITHYELRITN